MHLPPCNNNGPMGLAGFGEQNPQARSNSPFPPACGLTNSNLLSYEGRDGSSVLPYSFEDTGTPAGSVFSFSVSDGTGSSRVSSSLEDLPMVSTER